MIVLAAAADNPISYRGDDYTHRWSKDTQHEFTPSGQEDLSKWKDMLTVNLYPDVKSGEDLAKIANNLIGLYQRHGAHVLKTNSIPRTEQKEAEICTMEYAPVCGLVEVQCVTTPCDPIPQTFGNACGACAQGNVVSYTQGECTI